MKHYKTFLFWCVCLTVNACANYALTSPTRSYKSDSGSRSNATATINTSQKNLPPSVDTNSVTQEANLPENLNQGGSQEATQPIYKRVGAIPPPNPVQQPISTVIRETNESPPELQFPQDNTPPRSGCERIIGIAKPSNSVECRGGQQCVVGQAIQKQDLDQYGLIFRGSASTWELAAYRSQWDVQEHHLGDGSKVRANNIRHSPLPYSYKVNFGQFPNWSTWKTTDKIYFVISGYNQFGSHINTCQYQVQFESPIVLDLSGNQNFFKSLNPLETNILFDMDGDGTKERSGWIPATAGFLAIDLNGNGTIDNATELFGEHTGKKSFENGYKALLTMDEHKRGFIDETNKVFDKLLVWIDKNSNGSSEKGELFSLKELSITRIDTTFSNTHQPAIPFQNRVLYKSRFYGPEQCGKAGCLSYDVFFSTFSAKKLSRAATKTRAYEQ